MIADLARDVRRGRGKRGDLNVLLLDGTGILVVVRRVIQIKFAHDDGTVRAGGHRTGQLNHERVGQAHGELAARAD